MDRLVALLQDLNPLPAQLVSSAGHAYIELRKSDDSTVLTVVPIKTGYEVTHLHSGQVAIHMIVFSGDDAEQLIREFLRTYFEE